MEMSRGARNAQPGDAMYQVQAALLRQSSSDALLVLHAERAQRNEELITAKAKIKDLAAVQKHLCVHLIQC